MVFDRLRRRRYLGGAVAALTGLAGCNTDDTESATDTQRESVADPSATPSSTDAVTQAEVPEHDHSGSAAGGTTLSPEQVRATEVTGQTVQAGQLRAARTATGRHVAEPGELQTVLDDADPGDVVQMLPTKYQPAEEITVPRDITLDFNGGYIEVDADHTVIFPDNGTHLVSPTVVVPQDQQFNSAVVHLDTTRTTGSDNGGTYDPRYDQQVSIDGLSILAESFPDGDQSDSIGLHLDARGSYIQFNRIEMDIAGLDYQVVGTTTSDDLVGGRLKGYINGNRISGHFRNAQTTAVRHEGDWAMRSTIEGIIQPGNATEYGIVNASADKNRSVFLTGIIWDTGDTTAATKGARINMRIDNDLLIPPSEINDSPTEETTMYTGQTPGLGHVVRNGDGNMVSMRPDDVKSELYTDETVPMQMRASGGMTPPPQDLSALGPPELDRGIIYRHTGDGTIPTRNNGDSTEAGLYVWDDVDQVFERLAKLS